MDVMHKFARVRQNTMFWYAFYTCPNTHGKGFYPAKTTHTHKRQSRVPCLFRVERENRRLNTERR